MKQNHSRKSACLRPVLFINIKCWWHLTPVNWEFISRLSYAEDWPESLVRCRDWTLFWSGSGRSPLSCYFWPLNSRLGQNMVHWQFMAYWEHINNLQPVRYIIIIISLFPSRPRPEPRFKGQITKCWKMGSKYKVRCILGARSFLLLVT